MAGGALTPSGSYNGRITRFVGVSSMVAALGGLIFGYDGGVSGGLTSMEPFLKKFFPGVYKNMKEDTKVKFNSQILTLFTSSLYLAGLFAFIRLDHHTSIWPQAFAPYWWCGDRRWVGHWQLPPSMSTCLYLVVCYLELGLDLRIRGAFNNGFTFTFSLGALLAGLVNFSTEKITNDWGWRISIAAMAAPALIQTLGALFLLETPNSVILRTTDYGKAEITLQQIRGANYVRVELNDIIQATLVSETTTNSIKRLITQSKYRPQLLIAVALPVFQQMMGISVIGSYAPVLFRTIGFRESVSLLSTALIGAIGCLACIMLMLTGDRCRRRSLYFLGGAVMFVPIMVIRGIMATKLSDEGTLSEGYSCIVLVLICTYLVGFTLSRGALTNLVPSEIFQLEIRSAGQGIMTATNAFITFCMGQCLLAMLCVFKASIFFFFGTWIAGMTIFVYLFLPETKNVPIEKME